MIKKKMKTVNTVNKILALSNALEEIEVECFYYMGDDLGWIFCWYENEEEKQKGLQSFAFFPKEFNQTNGDNEEQIKKFLNTVNKKSTGDVPVIEFIKYVNKSWKNT